MLIAEDLLVKERILLDGELTLERLLGPFRALDIGRTSLMTLLPVSIGLLIKPNDAVLGSSKFATREVPVDLFF